MRAQKRRRWKTIAEVAFVAAMTSPALMKWMRRMGAARRQVDLRMTVVIERPLPDVFNYCRDFENFGKLVEAVRVDDFQDGRSHWVVRSPIGSVIEWDAVVTKYVPQSVVAWE